MTAGVVCSIGAASQLLTEGDLCCSVTRASVCTCARGSPFGGAQTTPDIDDLFTAYRVTAVVFDPAIHLPVHTRGFHPSSYRWLLIRDHLAGMGGGVGVNQPG